MNLSEYTTKVVRVIVGLPLLLLLFLIAVEFWPYAEAWIASYRTPLLLILTTLSFVSFGIVNGAFYAKRQSHFIGVHLASEINGAIAYIFAVVASLNPIPAFGAVLIGMFGFQCAVNLGSKLPCVNPNEKEEYLVEGSSFLQFKRWAVGYYRYIKLALGMIIVLNHYLWKIGYTFTEKIAKSVSLELLLLMKSMF